MRLTSKNEFAMNERNISLISDNFHFVVCFDLIAVETSQ